MPLFDVFWMLVMIAIFFAWLMLVFRVFADLLRSSDLSGIAKAVWALFVIVMPLLGTLAYVIARGEGMTERHIADAYRAAGGAGVAPADMRRAGSEVRMNTQGL